MKFLDKSALFFRLGLKDIAEEEVLHKVILNNLIFFIGLILCIFFGIAAFLNSQYLIAGIVAISLLLLIVQHIYLRKTLNVTGAAHFIILVLTLLLFALLATGGISGAGILWMFLAPIGTLFLLGIKRGTIISLVVFLFTAMLLIYPGPLFLPARYEMGFAIRALLIYLIIWFLIILFEHLRITHYLRLEEDVLKARNEAKTKDEFISKLSHQIRTPLNNIMVISDLLNNSKLDDNQKDLIETIVASTNNLVGVVNNIVRVSNIEISEKKDYQIKFDLFSTINNTLRLFQKNENLEVNLNFPGHIRQNLIGDPVKVKQIIMNLVDNITKFHSHRKAFIDIRVLVNLENEEQFVPAFELKTPLIPIRFMNDPDIKPNLGESEILETDVLDLGIARRLIEQGGGKLEISNTTQYTLFNFSLQFKKATTHKPEVAVEDKKAGGSPISRKTHTELKDANVLLVEDNLINQKIVLLSLKKVVRNIDVANNGKEALDKFGTSRYDVILMDIQMPIMDGILATRKIREIENTTGSFTPIIAITANALSGDREVCISAGMNDYIAKPFQIEVLIQKMRDLISG